MFFDYLSFKKNTRISSLSGAKPKLINIVVVYSTYRERMLFIVKIVVNTSEWVMFILYFVIIRYILRI